MPLPQWLFGIGQQGLEAQLRVAELGAALLEEPLQQRLGAEPVGLRLQGQALQPGARGGHAAAAQEILVRQHVVINSSLNEMFKFIMNLPEFHLC